MYCRTARSLAFGCTLFFQNNRQYRV